MHPCSPDEEYLAPLHDDAAEREDGAQRRHQVARTSAVDPLVVGFLGTSNICPLVRDQLSTSIGELADLETAAWHHEERVALSQFLGRLRREPSRSFAHAV